jgi:hypothetical protein
MRCPACRTKVEPTDANCPSCGVDLRWSVLGLDARLYGPYTVAEIRAYASLGNVQPWQRIQNRYGMVGKACDLGIATAPAAPMAPAAVALPKSSKPAPRVLGTVTLGFFVLSTIVGLAVWFAIGVPCLDRSQRAASRIGCLADTQALADALRSYAAAHEGRLPRSATWRQDVRPYLPAGKCPSCGPVRGVGAGYEMNPALSGVELYRAGDQPLVYDAGWMSRKPGPHNGAYTVAFTDGSAVWLPPEGK